MIFLLLFCSPSEIAVIKIETHTKRTEPEYQGDALADFHAKAEAIESIKIVAHVDEVHSASAENSPSLPGFAILMSL